MPLTMQTHETAFRNQDSETQAPTQQPQEIEQPPNPWKCQADPSTLSLEPWKACIEKGAFLCRSLSQQSPLTPRTERLEPCPPVTTKPDNRAEKRHITKTTELRGSIFGLWCFTV